MKKSIYTIIILAILMVTAASTFAGNPDRQGEAGAYELLMNPWARSAGLHTMNTASIAGVESIRLNPAGLGRIQNTQLLFGHTQYLVGTDISMNAVGFAQKFKAGVIGVSLMALDFGEINVTTEAQPEGTGATFAPSWINLGLSYAHVFENKVSVGVTFRGVSESTSDVSAFGFAFDAGVQYVAGADDNVKFGISLRNVGAPMVFKGEGLSLQSPSPDSEGSYDLTYYSRSADFELPSALNIGMSYDWHIGKSVLTALGNFTSNSFSRDQLGGGLEFTFGKLFALRGAYKYEVGSTATTVEEAPIYTGPSAGVSVQVPTSKKGDKFFGVDYAYRTTKLFDGTHNISVRFDL